MVLIQILIYRHDNKPLHLVDSKRALRLKVRVTSVEPLVAGATPPAVPLAGSSPKPNPEDHTMVDDDDDDDDDDDCDDDDDDVVCDDD